MKRRTISSRGRPRVWLVGAAVAASVWCGTAAVAIPEAAKSDPRFALGYVVVTHYPGVRADGTGDATTGIQAAIDDAEAAGHGRVFLPAGRWQIGGTLTLRARTKVFGVGRELTQIGCHDSWCPTTGEPTMLQTVNDPDAETTRAGRCAMWRKGR